MGEEGLHGPYGIVGRDMQTSLARRQRHRRNGAARRGRGGGGVRAVALAIPILLFGSFLALGGVGFLTAVTAYAHYARDLPDPAEAFQDLAFDTPSIIYDRTGTVELARLGERKRELVTFDQIPEELLDATTAIEDKDFWKNPGFDLGGFIAATIDTIQGRPRGGSTITQQLVRARLLPDWAFEGSVYDRKFREIIQSIRLTQAFPGEEGKKDIITAYLNQNFYGNQSYGVQAASLGYFGKGLDDLSLAQVAILAAIPQSPSEFDLVKNAVRICTVEILDGETCPAGSEQLVVPQTSEVVQRRDFVLDLMKTRSVLSGDRHTIGEYDAAKDEPVILVSQTSKPWKAAHFVWQVRRQLGSILCGTEDADSCESVDTGGYRIITTLDWSMQQVVDKWVEAVARAPHAADKAGTEAYLAALGIPEADWDWIVGLRPKEIHNGAAGILDYRTGQILAYAGSAGYYLPATEQFQPSFDVFGDGFRQPGSAIKPLNYITGLDDGSLTASTMFMDVVTNFGSETNPYTPSQSDGYERGPVRLRSALQFSFNVPSIKAGLINGLRHTFEQMKAFGLEFQSGTAPDITQSIGTLEIHAVDLLGAYGTIANGGVKMPRQLIIKVLDGDGEQVYPEPEAGAPIGERVVSAQASWLVTDILQGNTIRAINPYWSEWRILEAGKTYRPAAYKTGTTSDAKDVAAYGYLAPPEDPAAPALAVGVWMGNSDATPNKGSLSLDSSAPLWSRILTEVSQGMPIAGFQRPGGLVSVEVDAHSGLLPGPFTLTTVKEWFIEGTVPTQVDNMRTELDIDEATGKLWQDGCAGPMVRMPFLDFSVVEPRFPSWQPFTQEWAVRAAQGIGIVGGPEEKRTMWMYSSRFAPFGKTWGGAFAPTEICEPVLETCPPEPFPSEPVPIESGATPKPGGGPQPTPCPTPTPDPSEPPPSPEPSLPPEPSPAPTKKPGPP